MPINELCRRTAGEGGPAVPSFLGGSQESARGRYRGSWMRPSVDPAPRQSPEKRGDDTAKPSPRRTGSALCPADQSPTPARRYRARATRATRDTHHANGATLGARASRARALDLRRRQRRGDGTANRGALRLATKPRRSPPATSHPTYRPRVAQLRRITAIWRRRGDDQLSSYLFSRSRARRRPAEDPSGVWSSCAESGAILALTTPLSSHYYSDHAIPSHVCCSASQFGRFRKHEAPLARPAPLLRRGVIEDRRRARVVKGDTPPQTTHLGVPSRSAAPREHGTARRLELPVAGRACRAGISQ